MSRVKQQLSRPPYVTVRQLEQLAALLASRSDDLQTKDVDLETSEEGLVFVVEKPGKWTGGKLLERRSEVVGRRLTMRGLRPTGHQKLEQFATQFGGCYVVQKNCRRNRFNYISFDG
ncbi:hypothetical protein [Stigmatella aurantiaca]|uniref:Uncharacterized protein n=1 Tax=Stigmatella aurantiaca (strain DW4/3-1) TaxID=378806 RepID=E3FK74_STIAD|nr:hypothetical protein [Stigmatella aurantiaca]ADO75443.1 uncharacterized protein STAUR_7688 [Stigmatella aurantiaca DW4/3-1]